jgi:hypothetical protein
MNKEYREGELEIILSLPPTKNNIKWLCSALGRSKSAIEIVYRLAFGHGPFGKSAKAINTKILEAKKRVGIAIGRKTIRA